MNRLVFLQRTLKQQAHRECLLFWFILLLTLGPILTTACRKQTLIKPGEFCLRVWWRAKHSAEDLWILELHLSDNQIKKYVHHINKRWQLCVIVKWSKAKSFLSLKLYLHLLALQRLRCWCEGKNKMSFIEMSIKENVGNDEEQVAKNKNMCGSLHIQEINGVITSVPKPVGASRENTANPHSNIQHSHKELYEEFRRARWSGSSKILYSQTWWEKIYCHMNQKQTSKL